MYDIYTNKVLDSNEVQVADVTVLDLEEL
jgi:hypothetical protein